MGFIFVILFISCRKIPNNLEIALKFSGDNRIELEKVLSHYSTTSKDSLKYKAAVFLIKNMPNYYSCKNKKIEFYQKELYTTAIEHNCSGEEAFLILEQKYGYLSAQELQIEYDSKIITADYLIRNIEQAFKVWQEKPWGKYISFDDFCEQILPYRIGNEPLDDWRDVYYNRFQPILDSLLNNKKDPVEAIRVLWDTINYKKWVYFDKKPKGYTYPGALTLLDDCLFGNCIEKANRIVYIMRSLGIPGGIDGYLQHPYGQGYHRWNFVQDTLKNIWEFSYGGYPPYQAKRESPLVGRVFRYCFGVQQESLPMTAKGSKDLPPLLNNQFIRDVSENYLPDLSLTIKANRWKKKDDLLYLCTFGFKDWTPVAWCMWQNGEFTFTSIEKDMLYLPAYYKKGKLIPAGPPCFVNQYEICNTFSPDKKQKQDLHLYRKYPPRDSWTTTNKRIINGQFQGGNDSTFSNPVTLHTIKQESDMRWVTIDLPNKTTYRYVRYLSGDDGHCNMAEVRLIADNGCDLKGRIIGTEGSYQNELNNTKASVFDGDPLTFFDAKESNGAWAGLDFGEQKAIQKIKYLFRNDDNNIRIGDTYELFYWENSWISLGKNKAEEDVLEYKNVPSGALLWLHNETRGREERPFVYVSGKQIFVGE